MLKANLTGLQVRFSNIYAAGTLFWNGEPVTRGVAQQPVTGIGIGAALRGE